MNGSAWAKLYNRRIECVSEKDKQVHDGMWHWHSVFCKVIQHNSAAAVMLQYVIATNKLQCPSWGAKSHSDKQVINSPIMWDYRVHNSPSVVLILSQMNPRHALPSETSKIQINNVIPPMFWCSSATFPAHSVCLIWSLPTAQTRNVYALHCTILYSAEYGWVWDRQECTSLHAVGWKAVWRPLWRHGSRHRIILKQIQEMLVWIKLKRLGANTPEPEISQLVS